MAFLTPHIRVTAFGRLGPATGESDIFNWSLHLGGVVPFDASAALAAMDTAAIAATIGVFHQDSRTKINTRATLLGVKFAVIATNGSYEPGADPVIEELNGTTGLAGIAAGQQENQIAAAISLRTVTNIGTATRGRFYIPIPVWPLNPDGRTDSSITLPVAEAAKEMIDAINLVAASASPSSRVVLVSNVGGGAQRGVTLIRVGSVLDTIRRRRNALTEDYAQTAVAP